ncbi:MAG: RnfABCDGE type electron transport complex subunit B [Candidatus Anaerobiospirillum merdipullorum]|uniref:RnfABCDGE type electron transport complex subunit B n=1 Tax=Candidatus Anaerobiospirillum merdipullorum TaxID=2838450 RepID=A0A9E2KNQ8_9GAMM|nr:RnfABCDGE type electron transport complex subunit B [Candidatus Anaerobiospirillum merdipullorum]
MIAADELKFVLYLALSLFVLGLLLSCLARASFKEEGLAAKLERALPGAQCAQCGYPGCSAYAQALANGETTCDKCTPGGEDTIKELAAILNIDPPTKADEESLFAPRQVAYIHQSLCTGCHRCARHCPVDAIVGNIKQPHEILSEECIACGDCVKQCPENCIEMISMPLELKNFNWNIKSIRITGGNS